MASSQRSRVAIDEGLRTVIDEAAVVELLSFFPVRDVGERRDVGIDARTGERLAQIEGQLTRIEVLVADLRDGLAAIKQRITEREP